MSSPGWLARLLPEGSRRRYRQRVRVRPTREGWWFLLLLLGLTLAAFNTGNNLLYLVLATLLALLFWQNVLAEWNLRGLRVERRLPGEVFAFEGARGGLVLVNERRHFAAYGVLVQELEQGEAQAVFALVGAQDRVDGGATWTFGDRGPQPLGQVRLASDFPFGLFMRWRDLDLPAEVLVFPRRRQGPMARGHSGSGSDEDPAARRGGGAGDFQGLRLYTSGDSVRSIHWPNSARMSRPVVVVRAEDSQQQVLVRVPGRSGRLEEELAVACGQIVRHLAWGHVVGLELPGRRIDPAQGSAHRRRLLTALALHQLEEA